MLGSRRVLGTGGAGFIGSHLCEQLLARGDEVLCVDNFFTATRPNLAGLMLNSRLSSFDTMSASRSMSKSTRFTISPALRRPFIINSTRYRRLRPASTAPSTCWVSPSA